MVPKDAVLPDVVRAIEFDGLYVLENVFGLLCDGHGLNMFTDEEDIDFEIGDQLVSFTLTDTGDLRAFAFNEHSGDVEEITPATFAFLHDHLIDPNSDFEFPEPEGA